jgi:hypothetical protein
MDAFLAAHPNIMPLLLGAITITGLGVIATVLLTMRR